MTLNDFLHDKLTHVTISWRYQSYILKNTNLAILNFCKSPFSMKFQGKWKESIMKMFEPTLYNTFLKSWSTRYTKRKIFAYKNFNGYAIRSSSQLISSERKPSTENGELICHHSRLGPRTWRGRRPVKDFITVTHVGVARFVAK